MNQDTWQHVVEFCGLQTKANICAASKQLFHIVNQNINALCHTEIYELVETQNMTILKMLMNHLQTMPTMFIELLESRIFTRAYRFKKFGVLNYIIKKMSCHPNFQNESWEFLKNEVAHESLEFLLDNGLIMLKREFFSMHHHKKSLLEKVLKYQYNYQPTAQEMESLFYAAINCENSDAIQLLLDNRNFKIPKDFCYLDRLVNVRQVDIYQLLKNSVQFNNWIWFQFIVDCRLGDIEAIKQFIKQFDFVFDIQFSNCWIIGVNEALKYDQLLMVELILESNPLIISNCVFETKENLHKFKDFVCSKTKLYELLDPNVFLLQNQNMIENCTFCFKHDTFDPFYGNGLFFHISINEMGSIKMSRLLFNHSKVDIESVLKYWNFFGVRDGICNSQFLDSDHFLRLYEPLFKSPVFMRNYMSDVLLVTCQAKNNKALLQFIIKNYTREFRTVLSNSTNEILTHANKDALEIVLNNQKESFSIAKRQDLLCHMLENMSNLDSIIFLCDDSACLNMSLTIPNTRRINFCKLPTDNINSVMKFLGLLRIDGKEIWVNHFIRLLLTLDKVQLFSYCYTRCWSNPKESLRVLLDICVYEKYKFHSDKWFGQALETENEEMLHVLLQYDLFIQNLSFQIKIKIKAYFACMKEVTKLQKGMGFIKFFFSNTKINPNNVQVKDWNNRESIIHALDSLSLRRKGKRKSKIDKHMF